MINGVFGHYQAINNRLRAMCRERLDLCSTSLPFDQLTQARLKLIDLQLLILLRRHRMVRLVVSAIYAANLTFVTCMIGIAVAVASDSLAARIGALSLFLLGAGMLLFGLATMVVEISGSDRAVRLEVQQILAIEYRPATTPGSGPASEPRDEGSRGAEPAR